MFAPFIVGFIVGVWVGLFYCLIGISKAQRTAAWITLMEKIKASEEKEGK